MGINYNKYERGAGMNMKIPELNIKLNFLGKISKLFIKRTELAILMVVLITLIGISSYIFLPKESLPEIVFPSMSVQTVYPGASPINVEQLVTARIESRLASVEGVDSINSQSTEGFSFIAVTFDEGTDMDRKKLEVDGVLGDIDLPEGAFAPASRIFRTSEFPLISMSVTGDLDIFTLTQLAEQLSDDIRRVSGVAEVNVFGGIQREVRLVTDFERMEQYGIDFSDISRAIGAVNISASLGDIERDGQRLSIAMDETIREIEDIQKIPLFAGQFGMIEIGDVADIIDTSQPIRQFSRTYQTGSEVNNSVFIQVIRENRQDVIGTSRRVKDQVDQSKGSVLPEDVEVIILTDTAIQVSEDLGDIQSNALSGLLVVILVLFLFIGFRESLIVAITIPLTLFATLGFLGLFNITLNTFAVLGLIVSLGLLVDNTIIVMENIDRLSKKGIKSELSAVYGTNQVAYPITAATLTTVSAFFPLAILPGIVGAFINTIPRTIIITLITSLVLAITITPSVYYIVYRRFGKRKKTPSVARKITTKILKIIMVATLSVWAFAGEGVWIGIPIIATTVFLGATVFKEFFMTEKSIMQENIVIRSYQNILRSIIRSKGKMVLVIVVAVSLLASTGILFISGMLKVAFFPDTEPRSINLNIDAPGGKNLESTSEIVSRVEDILTGNKDISRFSSTIGGNEIDRAVISVDFSDTDESGFVKLERLRSELDNITEANITIETGIEAGPPVGEPINIKIRGNDLDANRSLAESYAKVLEQTPGVFNIGQSVRDGSPKLMMDIDVPSASLLGLSPGFIAFQVRNLTEGLVAGSFISDGNSVDIRITLDEKSLENPEKFLIKNPAGEMMELSPVINLVEVTGVSGIQRENQERTITVTADLEQGFNAREITRELQDIDDEKDIPPGIVVDFGGEAADIQENFGNLFNSMILAVLLVFIILTLQFGSVKQPFAIISTVPMAVIGVLYGLVITGNEFGFYAFMALVALVGIAVNDAIVLIDYMNYLRSQKVPFIDAVSEAGRTRFIPVIATTLTTSGGILPLSYKNPFYAQFGYALIFGLMVTTVMTLLIIPVMYTLLESKKAQRVLKSDKIV